MEHFVTRYLPLSCVRIVTSPRFLWSSGAVQSIAGDTVQRVLGLPVGFSGRRRVYLPLGVRGKTEKRQGRANLELCRLPVLRSARTSARPRVARSAGTPGKRFEQSQGSDCKLEDAPADYLKQMASAVFGIRFTSERCRAHKKIS